MNAETQEVNAEPGRLIVIVVNGERSEVTSHQLTFEEVVRLAFDDAVFSDSIVYTITFKRGPHQNREGTLVKGETVFVTNGMIFNVKRTDKS